jgi:hypothetical protein
MLVLEKNTLSSRDKAFSLFFVAILTHLVSYGTRRLAGGLAGSLALAATLAGNPSGHFPARYCFDMFTQSFSLLDNCC